MSLLFKKKPIEKESNIASAPEHIKAPSPFSAKKFYIMLWNILSMAFYCIYVFYLIFKVPEISFLYNIIVYVLYGYGIALALILLFSIGKKSKRKARLKNYKSAIKFLQYTIQIVSFVLLIVTAVSALFTTGKLDIRALTNALSSLILTCIMIFFEVIKIMVRKNVPVVKENFLRLKEEDTIYKKIDLKFKKFRKKKNEDLESSEKIEAGSDNSNLLNPVIDVNDKTEEAIDENNENIDFKFESEEEIAKKLNLSKNEKYDKESGVVICYDDDEESDYEDYEDYDEAFYDNKLVSRKNKKSKTIGLFNRFRKR